MKKTKAAMSRRQPRSVVLDQRDLTEVIGGTGGTIIVENLVPGTMGISGGALSQGIQGSGHG